MSQAITMARLMVWVVRQKRADLHAASRDVMGHREAGLQASRARLGHSSTAQAARTAQLGTRIDTSSVPLRVDLDADAEAIYLTAEAELTPGAFAAIVRHGRHDTQPEWGEGLTRWDVGPELVWCARDQAGPTRLEGKVVTQPAGEGWWPRIRRAGGRQGSSNAWCPVVYRDRLEELQHLRAAWLQWWGALEQLRQVIESRPIRLRRWQISGVGAQEKPWLAGRVKKNLDESLPS